MRTVEYILGDALAGYLVNGDESAYCPIELGNFIEWLTNENLGRCLGIVESLGYCRTNDYDSLGQNCSIYSFTI
jgi:hypothetical protein